MAARCGYAHPDWAETPLAIHYLVPREMKSRAAILLEKEGHPVRPDPGKLIQPGRSPVILNVALGGHQSDSRLREQAGSLQLGGRILRHLAPCHWLLHLSHKHAANPNGPLSRSWEITCLAQTVRDEGWPDLMAEAEFLGLETKVAAAVTNSFHALNLSLSTAMRQAFTANTASLTSPVDKEETVRFPTFKVPFLATPQMVMDRMLALAEIGPGDVVYDLGCGDGRFVVKAARDYGARGVGIDLDPARIAEAEVRATKAGVDNRVSFVCGDVFNTSLLETSVLCRYLMPEFYPRIRERLLMEARPGTRVVSHNYVFPDWPPEKTEIIRVGPLKVSQIYLWRIT